MFLQNNIQDKHYRFQRWKWEAKACSFWTYSKLNIAIHWCEYITLVWAWISKMAGSLGFFTHGPVHGFRMIWRTYFEIISTGWTVSAKQPTWTWHNSGRQWKTGGPGVLWSMGSQRVGHDLTTKQQKTHCVSNWGRQQDSLLLEFHTLYFQEIYKMLVTTHGNATSFTHICSNYNRILSFQKNHWSD